LKATVADTHVVVSDHRVSEFREQTARTESTGRLLLVSSLTGLGQVSLR